MSAPIRVARHDAFSTTRIVKNTSWNLAGTVLPLIVAVVALPILFRDLGSVRFGLLALALALIGSMSIFDFGLSRGLTQIVASGVAHDSRLGAAVWTAQLLTALLGVMLAIGMFLLVPWFVSNALHLRGSLGGETRVAFQVLSVGLPLEVSSAGFRGVIEGQHRFDLSNFVRIPLSVLLYGAPLAVLPFTHNVIIVFGVLVLIRMAAWASYVMTSIAVSPWLGPPRFALSTVLPVIRLASWMSISNFMSPLLVYADRFVVAAVLSISAVAYYAVPFDLITKTLIISAALSSVLFPGFAQTFNRDRAHTLSVFFVSGRYLFITMLPITVVVVALAHELLRAWLGAGFADRSTTVLQLLAFGAFSNALAAVSFALIQGIGRPDLTAKVHIMEVAVYIVLLWQATQHWGIVGAAFAWTLRVVVDMVLLYWFAWRLLSAPLLRILRQGVAYCAASVFVGASAIIPVTQPLKNTVLVLSLAAFATIVLMRFMGKSHRARLL